MWFAQVRVFAKTKESNEESEGNRSEIGSKEYSVVASKG